MSFEKKAAAKCVGIGPGGIHCTCCVPFRGRRALRTAKRALNRSWRRIQKQALKEAA